MRPLPKLALSNISRPPALDRSLVGISFVDVLFALVIGRILAVATRWDDLTAPGISHLTLAFLLTVASWIGYHNSLNRPRFFIRFANLPLFQFLIDVALVVAYWFTAAYVDAPQIGLREVSAIPEVNLVFICFVLYWAWDLIGYRIRKSEMYPQTPLRLDNRDRRLVTECFGFLLFLTALFLNFLWTPTSHLAVVAVDVWLILLVIAFRISKEATPSPKFEPVDVRLQLEEIRAAAEKALGSSSLEE